MLPLRWGDVRPLLLLLQVCSGYLMNVNCREMPVEELVVPSGRVLLQLSGTVTGGNNVGVGNGNSGNDDGIGNGNTVDIGESLHQSSAMLVLTRAVPCLSIHVIHSTVS